MSMIQSEDNYGFCVGENSRNKVNSKLYGNLKTFFKVNTKRTRKNFETMRRQAHVMFFMRCSPPSPFLPGFERITNLVLNKRGGSGALLPLPVVEVITNLSEIAIKERCVCVRNRLEYNQILFS